MNRNEIEALEHRVASGIWLLGEDYANIPISETTYVWLWRNVNVICTNKRLFSMFWANSSQYYEFNLKSIYPKYNSDFIVEKNEKEIKFREGERADFFEFHIAVGGLLYYHSQYESIRYIFRYTQSQPPTYPLLPNSMIDIFKWFDWFFNSDYRWQRQRPIDFKYSFKGIDNLGESGFIVNSICSYIVLLFIRQFTLQKYLITQDFVQQPHLPEKVYELESWKKNVDYFEKLLEKVLKNEKLIESIGFDEIIKLKETEIVNFIPELKKNISNKIAAVKKNAPISKTKKELFVNSTKDVFQRKTEKYRQITLGKSSDNFVVDIEIPVEGDATIISKSVFTEDDIPNANFDTVLPEVIFSNTLDRLIPKAFFTGKTRRYLLRKEKLIDGIEKLEIDEDFIIVGFNLMRDVENLLEKSNIKTLLKKINSSVYQVRNLFFILRKDHLPLLEFKDVSAELKTNLKLEKVTDFTAFDLYTSIETIEHAEKEDLQVQVSIQFSGTIKLVKQRDIVQIDVVSRSVEQGKENEIREIVSFTNDSQEQKNE